MGKRIQFWKTIWREVFGWVLGLVTAQGVIAVALKVLSVWGVAWASKWSGGLSALYHQAWFLYVVASTVLSFGIHEASYHAWKASSADSDPLVETLGHLDQHLADVDGERAVDRLTRSMLPLVIPAGRLRAKRGSDPITPPGTVRLGADPKLLVFVNDGDADIYCADWEVLNNTDLSPITVRTEGRTSRVLPGLRYQTGSNPFPLHKMQAEHEVELRVTYVGRAPLIIRTRWKNAPDGHEFHEDWTITL